MTGATNKRIDELINEVEEGRLVLRPAFQRRLVWTNVVKDKFLETVSLGLPFPEIFIATGELNTKTRRRVNWLVDGQQRISTLRQYVNGSDDLRLKLVKPYAELNEAEKRRFLDYQVAVRDLGIVTEDQISDVFQRINSTDYALRRIEKLNALFSGAYVHFCEELALHDFFQRNSVFTLPDRRRMRDLDFCVILVTTLLSTYYHRDDLNEEYLQRYNDEFAKSEKLRVGINDVFAFVEDCKFDRKSRVWKKTDLFSLLVELYSAKVVRGLKIAAGHVGKTLADFYDQVDQLYKMGETEADPGDLGFSPDVFRYLKAATKATNDKYARVNRGEIVAKLIESTVNEPNASKGKASKKKRKNAG